MTTRDDLIAYALECMGTPFIHLGRSPGAGLDCVGVVVHMCRRAGFAYSDLPAYNRQPYHDQLASKLREQPCMREIKKRHMQTADIFICKVSRVYPQHLCVLDGDYIIHANGIQGKVERIRFTAGFRNTVTRAFTWVGIDE